MKQIIKLTEQDLHRIVKDALNAIINENSIKMKKDNTKKDLCKLIKERVTRCDSNLEK